MAIFNKEIDRYFKNLDWYILVAFFLISLTGIIFVYSATYNMSAFTILFTKQILAIFLGLILIVVFSILDYASYYELAKYLYFFSIFLLILVLIFGSTVRGSKSWFNFGFLSFQPSEFARFSSVIFLCVFLDKNIRNIHKFSVFLKALLLPMPIFVLILMQPDFGAILVLFPILLGLFFVVGIRKTYLFSLLLLAFFIVFVPLLRTFFIIHKSDYVQYTSFFHLLLFFSVPIFFVYFIGKMLYKRLGYAIFVYLFFIVMSGLTIGNLGDGLLKDYQRNRIAVFFNPESDRLGAGYNVIQSKIAVGSGGLLGKGLKGGTQVQLGFLPERHTDFIFSVIAEEGGFWLSSIVILFFLLICYRILKIAQQARDRFGSILATSFLIMFSFFVILNIGFVLGLLPVTGVPLPFISYGGSSFLINSMIIGILLNIHIKRYTN